jgi:hypothetical protein
VGKLSAQELAKRRSLIVHPTGWASA